MPSDINLLVRKKSGIFSEEQLLVVVRVLAVVSVILVISLSILFFLLSRDPSIVQVKADESRTIAQLTLLQNKTAKYLLIIDRVNKIKALNQTRTNFDAIITTITSTIPSGILVTNFTLDKNTFSLSLSARDLSLLGQAVNNFTQLVVGKKTLKEITIQGLVSDERAQSYVLTLSGDLL